MDSEIDVSGYDFAETMTKERRRRSEAERAEGLGELAALVLPLSIAFARLVARVDVAAVGA